MAESGEQGGDRDGHTDQHHEDDSDRIMIDDYVRTLDRGDGDHDAHDGHPDDEREDIVPGVPGTAVLLPHIPVEGDQLPHDQADEEHQSEHRVGDKDIIENLGA